MNTKPDYQELKDKYGIVCYALRNKKNRYFLPGKKNLFDNIECERVMFDTGCNSILLPLPINLNYEDFFLKYQNNSCSISYSGTESMSSPTLRIRAATTTPFPIQLENSVVTFSVTQLRFHLSLEETQQLLNYSKSCELQSKPNPFKTQDVKNLEDFLSIGGTLTNAAPGLKFGKRRNHGLIGQEIFQRFVIVQNSCVEILIDPLLAKPSVFDHWSVVDKIFVEELEELLKTDLAFNDLEDEDHDEENDLESKDVRFIDFEYHD